MPHFAFLGRRHPDPIARSWKTTTFTLMRRALLTGLTSRVGINGNTKNTAGRRKRLVRGQTDKRDLIERSWRNDAHQERAA